jgi:acetyl-CoA acetyltransferase
VIAGIGESDSPLAPHLDDFGHHAQAASRALADAGLGLADVDGYATPSAQGMDAVRMAEYLGLRPRWIDGSNTGGSSFEVLLEHAADAIRAGRAETVLITYGQASRSSGAAIGTRERGGPLVSGVEQWEAPFGITLVGAYALAAQRHMHLYGTTSEQLARIAVQSRANAAFNPRAMYRDPITVEDVLASPMVADPLHRLDCCVISDGGGGLVLTTEERARDLPSKPVHVLGAASASDHVGIAWASDLTTTAAALSGARAFRQAGLSPADVDLCMLYDSFTITVLLQFEDLGFCAKGEGGEFVSTTRLRYNTDGGGLSANHPGMRGIFLVTEAVRRLRAGDAKVALANGSGGQLSVMGTVLLSLEPSA